MKDTESLRSQLDKLRAEAALVPPPPPHAGEAAEITEAQVNVEKAAGQILKGHESEVMCLAFSKSGQRLLSGSTDGTLRLWHVETQECAHVFRGHKKSVTWCALHEPDRTALSTSADMEVRVWDASTGSPLRVLTGHKDVINSAAVIPHTLHGPLLATAANDVTVRVWALSPSAGAEPMHTLKEHTGEVMQCAYVALPSGAGRLVSCSWDKTLKVWQTDVFGAAIGTLKGHQGAVTSFAPSADGRQIASASTDGKVRIWDTETFDCSRVLDASLGEVHTVRWACGDVQLFSCAADGGLRRYNLVGDSSIMLDGHRDTVLDVSCDSENKHACSISADRRIIWWNLSSGAELGRLVTTVCPSTLSSWHGRLFAVGDSSGEVWVFGPP